MTAARVKPTLLTKEIAAVREQLAAAVADASALRLQLAGVQEELLLVRAHNKDLAVDNANLSDALAECAHLLDRCVPGGVRDRELAPLIRGYRLLAGGEARERVLARIAEMPDLGTPSSVDDAPKGKCGDPPPKLAAETHLPCKFVAGHGGDHLWPARDERENAITGQVPR